MRKNRSFTSQLRQGEGGGHEANSSAVLRGIRRRYIEKAPWCGELIGGWCCSPGTARSAGGFDSGRLDGQADLPGERKKESKVKRGRIQRRNQQRLDMALGEGLWIAGHGGFW
jgi:hypothetical protein